MRTLFEVLLDYRAGNVRLVSERCEDVLSCSLLGELGHENAVELVAAQVMGEPQGKIAECPHEEMG